MGKKIIFLFLIFNSGYAGIELKAWNVHGQTFLVWKNFYSSPTYYIYRSKNPITSIGDAELVGRVYSNNALNIRLKDYLGYVYWKIPDSSGEIYTLKSDEVYFVYTPHEEGTAYYAVLKEGDTRITSDNTVGPVSERCDSITCIIQYEDSAVIIFGHWIDGRKDYNSGRKDYPVMGNLWSNGLGFNFALWKPKEEEDSLFPLVISLHGGTQNLFDVSPVSNFRYYVELPNGFLMTPDDYLPAKDTNATDTTEVNTFWFGYNNEYNIFSPLYPSDTAIVVDYTRKRILWEINWIKKNFPVDTERISIMGVSMGGNGALILSQLHPDYFSAALSFIPPGDGPENPSYLKLLGTKYQNLKTNLENAKIFEIFDWEWRIKRLKEKKIDPPYTIIISGKNDQIVEWQDRPRLYRFLDSAKTGFSLYWDERYHLLWFNGHFKDSQHHRALYISRFFKNKSYPGFYNTDLYPEIPGRQPDPGNGSPDDGDPWGTWGGYIEWDSEEVKDTPDEWQVKCWVTGVSPSLCDVPPVDSLIVSLVPKRVKNFKILKGEKYLYTIENLSKNGIIIQDTITADEDGVIDIKDIFISKDTFLISIKRLTGIQEFKESGNTYIPISFTKSINYRLSKPGKVSIKIYNVLGQHIRTLVQKEQERGNYSVVWDGKDDKGKKVTSGIYFCEIRIKGNRELKKIIIIGR